jgi:hypothetical protein
MSITVRNLISDGLVAIRVGSIGDPIDGDISNIAVNELNSAISMLNMDDYFLFQNTTLEFNPSASNYSYSIGLSGDIVSERPLRIMKAYYAQSNTSVYNDNMFQIAVQDIYGKRNQLTSVSSPVYYAYDAGLPNGNIMFDSKPFPNSKITLVIKKSIPQVTINSVLDIPDEYEDALKWTMCETLAGRFGKPVELLSFCSKQASASLRRIKSIGRYNDPSTRMSSDNGLFKSILTF